IRSELLDWGQRDDSEQIATLFSATSGPLLPVRHDSRTHPPTRRSTSPHRRTRPSHAATALSPQTVAVGPFRNPSFRQQLGRPARSIVTASDDANRAGVRKTQRIRNHNFFFAAQASPVSLSLLRADFASSPFGSRFNTSFSRSAPN